MNKVIIRIGLIILFCFPGLIMFNMWGSQGGEDEEIEKFISEIIDRPHPDAVWHDDALAVRYQSIKQTPWGGSSEIDLVFSSRPKNESGFSPSGGIFAGRTGEVSTEDALFQSTGTMGLKHPGRKIIFNRQGENQKIWAMDMMVWILWIILMGMLLPTMIKKTGLEDEEMKDRQSRA